MAAKCLRTTTLETFFTATAACCPGLKLPSYSEQQAKACPKPLPNCARTSRPAVRSIFKVANKAAALDRVRSALQDKASKVDELDGLSLTFDTWRFNLRASNTENLLRLNIEGKDAEDVQLKVAKISNLINA